MCKLEIEEQVICDIMRRALAGRLKYGVSVKDNPLTEEQWMQHLYEELLDAAVYLKRLMDMRRSASERDHQHP